jgi:hypothetical protein
MGLIDINSLYSCYVFVIYLRAVNYFHVTPPLSCRVQLSSMNGLRNVVAFTVYKVHTPSRAIFKLQGRSF